MGSVVLQQFARLPRVGAVKTRLQSELSAFDACAVHCELMLSVSRALVRANIGSVELWLDCAGSHPTVEACLEAGVSTLRLQQGTDLGARMEFALTAGLAEADSVVLVGSDCPTLDGEYLEKALLALQSVDLVWGPAQDGGFVMVACRRVVAGMFDRVEWGVSSVLAACEGNIKRVGLRSTALPPLYDIDTPDDLRRWRGEGVRRVRPEA
jgi:rSAM/selenodomain-associated transferase 1